MSVTLQTPYNVATGNGASTVFPYQFLLLAATDLAVYLGGILKTNGADYSVSNVGAVGGGNVTFVTAPGNGVAISLIRAMRQERLTDYQQLGDFLTAVVNPDFDRAILIAQDNLVQLQRSIRVPAWEPSAAMTLPAAATRANTFITFDSSGNLSVAVTLPSGTLSAASIGSFLYPRTARETAAAITPANYAYPEGYLRRYGAVLDGAADDYTPLNQAVSVAAAIAFTIFIDGPANIGSNITIPDNVTLKFLNEGLIKPANGKTLTIKAFIDAEPVTIFGNFASGTITFAAGNQREFYPEWWGAISLASTNSYTALNACFQAASTTHSQVNLTGGYYRFDSDLTVPNDITVVGKGITFATSLYPSGAAKLYFNGSFRSTLKELVVDCAACTNVTAIDITNGAYNITLDHVYVVSVDGEGSASNLRGISVSGGSGNTNGINLNNCRVDGSSQAVNHIGIQVGSGAFVTITEPDIENFNRGIYVTGTARVDIISPYTERCASGLYFNRTGAGGCNVFGGWLRAPSAGQDCISIAPGTSNVNIYSPSLELNGGRGVSSTATIRLDNVNIYGIETGDITDPENSMTKVGNSGIASYWVDTFYSKKTQTDNTVTSHFTATLATSSMMVCDWIVFCTLGGGFVKEVRHVQFMMTCPAGTAEISTVQPVGTNVDESSSGNYGVTLTLSSALATNTCTLKVTADSTGAIGNGQSVDVYTELRVRCMNLNNHVTAL